MKGKGKGRETMEGLQEADVEGAGVADNPPSSTPSRFCFLALPLPLWLEMLLRCSPLVALLGLVVSAGYFPYSHAATPIQAVDGGTTYTGSCDSNVCSWFGIRYAAAPVGNLRFAAAQPPPSPGANVSALTMGLRCPQSGTVSAQNEDCLFLNIQRPSATPLTTKLPVLVFFHGGGFETGSGNDNDPTKLVQISAQYNQPTIVVRISYRLAIFGFLASSELETLRNNGVDNVALNNGFRDMRTATQWVKEHIAAFGGDASKLTIWGQSAGSFGASAQLLAFPSGGAPFQSAILESGAPGGVPINAASSKDAQYARVLSSANCSSAADHVACLRALPWQTLRTISLAESSRAMQPATYALGFYAWTGVIDGGPSKDGFYASRPSTLISSGAFAKVPILHGDCLDEGTYFVPHTFNNTAATQDWLSRVYFSNPTSSATTALVNKVLTAYPDVPSQGSPYVPVGASSNDRFYGSTNQYKRAASVYGDIRYQANRRFFLSALASQGVKAYGYLYAEEHSGDAPALGVPHGTDLQVLLQSTPNAISVTYARQYLAFANAQDPNASGLPTWPVYTTSSPTLQLYYSDRISTYPDNFRASAMNVLNEADVLSVTGR